MWSSRLSSSIYMKFSLMSDITTLPFWPIFKALQRHRWHQIPITLLLGILNDKCTYTMPLADRLLEGQIFVFTECKNNRFPKKLSKEKQTYEYSPPWLSICQCLFTYRLLPRMHFTPDSSLFDKLESISKAGTSYTLDV